MLWARECEDASSPPPNPQKWVEVNDFKSSPSDHRQADQSIYIYQESNKQCIYKKNTCLYIQIHHKRAVHASWIPWSINPQLHAICHANTCDNIFMRFNHLGVWNTTSRFPSSKRDATRIIIIWQEHDSTHLHCRLCGSRNGSDMPAWKRDRIDEMSGASKLGCF